MQNSIQYVAVFCSSSNFIDHQYFEAAKELGELIGSKHLTLIHGGGKVGLMGTLAESTQKNGGKVIGIIPEKLNKKGIVRETDDETIVTTDMHKRKEKMFELADVFFALPGGFGTIEELLEVITLKQLDYHKKPIIILNINHFYDHLLSQLIHIFEQNFARQAHRNLWQTVNTVKDIQLFS